MNIIGVRQWAVVVGLAMVAAVGAGAWAALRKPGPPEPCRETVEIVMQGGDVVCPPGSEMETTVIERETWHGYAKVQVRCRCPKAVRP